MPAPDGSTAGADADGDLVASLARGERAALALLYDRHASYLLAIALRVLSDRREAEDLLHDVFLEVWRAAGDYDASRGRVRTWLAVRMRSRAIDRVQSARARRRTAGVEELDGVAADNPAPTPDKPRVHNALGTLGAEQRRVIELAYFDGLTCAEIATTLTIPIGTVKSRMAAALSRLRTVLDVPAASAEEVRR